MKSTFETVIIGGGVVGCSIAYNLACRGMKDILLVEKGYLSSGATGRCGAGIRQQWGTETNCILARESVKDFQVLGEMLEYSRDIEFKQKGYLMLAFSREELQNYRRNVTVQNSLGIPSEIVSPEEAKEIVPLLNVKGLAGGAFCSSDGHANPFHVTRAYADAAVKKGVEIQTYTEVTAIQQNGHRVTGINTTAGPVTCENIVIAAGAHTGIIGRMAGVSLPITPERHEILVTEPVEQLLGPMVVSLSHHIYCQQTPHGSIIAGMGNPNEPQGFNQNSSSYFVKELAGRLAALAPLLTKVRVVRQWAGLYAMSPDGNPMLGPCPPVKGLWVAAGFSGHGFMIAPAVGRVMADWLTGSPLSLPVESLHTTRFAEGKYFREPMIV